MCGGWRDGPAVKRVGCSPRRPWFGSSAHMAAHNVLTPSLGHCGNCIHTGHGHTCLLNTHKHELKINTFLKCMCRACEMAQQIKVLATESHELSLNPRTHVLEELTPESCSLVSTLTVMYTFTLHK